MQTKLHQWAMADPDRRFDDLFNLVYDPAFLVVAWRRVRGQPREHELPGLTGWHLARSSSSGLRASWLG
jgi:hypothetical protein